MRARMSLKLAAPFASANASQVGISRRQSGFQLAKKNRCYTTFTWWNPKSLHCCCCLGTCGSWATRINPFPRFGSACLGSGSWPPVHRSVRPLHDFCWHLLRVDAARPLESAERSFEISQEQRFSLYVKIENFARPRPLVADFETSRNRIPPRVLAFSGPSLLCA